MTDVLLPLNPEDENRRLRLQESLNQEETIKPIVARRKANLGAHVTGVVAQEQITEKELARNVISEAKNCGWLVARTWLSKFSPAGEPDLRMVRNGKLFCWELKTSKGKVSPAQQTWLDALAQVPGIDVRVVRPDDLEQAYQALVSGEWPR